MSGARMADQVRGTASAAEAQVRASAAAVGSLRQDVAAGRLRLDPVAGQEIQHMLAEQVDQVQNWLKRATDLGRRAPLGRNPVGQAVAAKLADHGTGDEDSFTGVLQQYRQVLEDTREAVEDAMRRSRADDERAEEEFRRIGQQL
ncbi:hypothetical protein [Saccharopolyspora gregorii]|uniref:hypothetical protein n=1 Tax=Saccharopolyspora gregorii TaxID=33914 RepID=UPI0021AC618C|nr:hypothetical protein [Saccharopolyspora gregorii]